MKNKIISLFFFSLFLWMHSAYATVDRTHVTITNNTNESIVLSTNLTTEDTAFIKGTDWDETSLTLMPYESKEILWFKRDTGIHEGFTYHFAVLAKNEQHPAENLVVHFTETAKPIYGSNVVTEMALGDAEKKKITADKGLFHYPLEMWGDNYIVHARRFQPLNNMFSNYHFVIDKPETQKIVADKKTEISVLTYNTQLQPFYAGTVNDLNQPSVREKDIAASIAGYDVVIFQELFDRALRNAITNDMKAKYAYHTRVVGDSTSKIWTGGVMIFSKWPIIKEDQIVYKANSGIDDYAAKGVVYAAIDKQGKTYHVFGTHAVAGGDEASTRARAKELVEFSDFMARMNIPADEPVLLGGDFNVNQFAAEIDALTATLQVKQIDNIGYKYSCDGLVDTMDKGGDRVRLDYVFFSTQHVMPKKAYNKVFVLRALDHEKMWPKFDLSDHFPVESYFDFSE